MKQEKIEQTSLYALDACIYGGVWIGQYYLVLLYDGHFTTYGTSMRFIGVSTSIDDVYKLMEKQGTSSPQTMRGYVYEARY